MKLKIQSRRGITLIELMLAITASLIVILATGVVVVFGQTSWNDTWKKANLQRDASYAMLRMNQSIKRATSATVDGGGSVLTIDGGSTIFSYVEDTNDLQCQIGGQTENVITGQVYNLQFSKQGDTIGITLDLRAGNAETRFESTVMMRNTGG